MKNFKLPLVQLFTFCSLLGMALASTAQTKPSASASTAKNTTETAIFAGGCFWCVEYDFDKVPGVLKTTSGYTGGNLANPSYEAVSSKNTGHAEAVEIVFDPKKISYRQLVDFFWKFRAP